MSVKPIQEVQAGRWAWSFRSSALPQLGSSRVSFTMILVRACPKLAPPDALVLPRNLPLEE